MVNRLDDSPAFPSITAPPPAARTTRASTARRATPEEVFALVYSQVRKLAGSRDVDDIAQAAAEQAIRALPGFEGRSQLSTWTYRISYLTIRKHDRWYRRWLRRFTLTLDGDLPEEASLAAASDEQLEAGERLGRLQSALAKLSTKRRTVILLHDVDGLSIDEIALIVEAAPVAVRSRLRDARKTLSEALRDDPYFGDIACRREAKK